MLSLLDGVFANRAAFVDQVPFGDNNFVFSLTLENRATIDERLRPRAAIRSVSSAYFNVFSIPLLDGRVFRATEDADLSNVAVVNDAFVRTYFSGERIVGHRLKRGNALAVAPWMTVVGVVGSVRSAGLGLGPEPEVFVPYNQSASRYLLNLLVKTSSPQGGVVLAIGQRLHAVDSALSPTAVTTERELVSRGLGRPLFYARLFGVLAVAAFALGLIGVYGVAVLSISARTSELLLRICLGAQRGDILRLVFGDAAIAIVAAAVAGSLGAIALQQWMAGIVFGVQSIDWAITASAVAVMSLFAFAAVYLAARRVMDLVPADALKAAPRV
jgi:hypothetical protein